jgi:hypothetical protein
MVEGFRIIAAESDTISTPANLFPQNVTFSSDTPTNYAREIQVSIWAGASSVLSLVLNGTSYVINNGTALQGAIVFTLLVQSTDTFNITTNGSNVPLVVTLAG